MLHVASDVQSPTRPKSLLSLDFFFFFFQIFYFFRPSLSCFYLELWFNLKHQPGSGLLPFHRETHSLPYLFFRCSFLDSDPINPQEKAQCVERFIEIKSDAPIQQRFRTCSKKRSLQWSLTKQMDWPWISRSLVTQITWYHTMRFLLLGNSQKCQNMCRVLNVRSDGNCNCDFQAQRQSNNVRITSGKRFEFWRTEGGMERHQWMVRILFVYSVLLYSMLTISKGRFNKALFVDWKLE